MSGRSCDESSPLQERRDLQNSCAKLDNAPAWLRPRCQNNRNNKDEELVRAPLIYWTIVPSPPTRGRQNAGHPVHGFVDGAIASTYDLRLSGFLESAPRPTPNPCFTSLKIVRRF